MKCRMCWIRYIVIPDDYFCGNYVAKKEQTKHLLVQKNVDFKEESSVHK